MGALTLATTLAAQRAVAAGIKVLAISGAGPAAAIGQAALPDLAKWVARDEGIWGDSGPRPGLWLAWPEPR